VHLIERKKLAAPESFVATFDEGVEADEAFGSCVLAAEGPGRSGGLAPARVGGARGEALQTPFRMSPHLNLADEAGSLSFQALLPAGAKGEVLSAGRAQLAFRGGKTPELVLTCDLNRDERDPRGRAVRGKNPALIKTAAVPAPAAGWHVFELAWRAGRLGLSIDGKPVGEVEFAGFGIGKPLGKDLTAIPDFTFGARGGAEAVDDLRCRR
jgi:hypothetical protein